MIDPFIGEIRIMANSYPPFGWAWCNGQSIAIVQNTALYSIIGTAFGGNGTTTFNLPDFRGAAPVGTGQGNGLSPVVIGEFDGVADVTLTNTTMPIHSHTLTGRTLTGSQGNPENTMYPCVDAGGAENVFYMVPGATVPDVLMAGNSLGLAGSGTSHPNTQPYLTLGFCISLSGEYPSRN